MRRTNLIGIDISDASIKVLQLDEERNVRAYGAKELKGGTIENGRIVDQDAFASALQEIFEQTKPKELKDEIENSRAIICLQETKLFTCTVPVPAEVKKGDLQAYVQKEAEKIIPFEFDEIYWDFDLTDHGGKRTAVFVSSSKPDLDQFVKAFHEAGIRPSFVGSELFCLGRALLPDAFENTQIIVDIGANTTSIGIFVHDTVCRASIVIPHGGSYFTEKIAENLHIPMSDAEALKRSEGLAAPESRSYIILKECMQLLVNEIKRAKTYYEEAFGHPITKIVAAGGSSLLPGLCDFLNEQTGVETVLADPLKKITGVDVFEHATPKILYSTVIGLALLTANDIPKLNLLTQYRYEDSDAQKEAIHIKDIRSWVDAQYVAYRIRKEALKYFSKMSVIIPVYKRLNTKLLLSTALTCSALGFLAWVIIVYI